MTVQSGIARRRGAHVQLLHVSKRFGATQALNDVSLEILPGEIHALVGENGAGKSTLGKIIGGIYQPDSGVVVVDGDAVGRWRPANALAAGVATIQQELALVPARSVAENVFLGMERTRFGVLRGSVTERYDELEQFVKFGIPAHVKAGSLRIADRQKVEIMRALARDARLIVLDEPTSSLTHDESERLHELMRRLREQGCTLVYVSHFLDEVLAVADRVTVMRDGVLARTSSTAAETKSSLVEAMLGRPIDVAFPEPRPVDEQAPVVLEARNLTGHYPVDISFSVRAGEIVGLAGLVGSGRTEVCRMLCGADRVLDGTVLLDGRDLGRLTPRRAIDAGLVMVPEDRRGLGLILTQTTRENVTLPRLSRFRQVGLLRSRTERAAVRHLVERLGIVPTDPDGAVRYYSGGNQQKVLFAKWILERPRVIILDEPTRGVDVGAKQAIYEAILRIADEGVAIVLVSSEFEELLGLSHRVVLLGSGRVIDEASRGELEVSDVLARLFGADDMASHPTIGAQEGR